LRGAGRGRGLARQGSEGVDATMSGSRVKPRVSRAAHARDTATRSRFRGVHDAARCNHVELMRAIGETCYLVHTGRTVHASGKA
jgi:hypothetical protein